MTDLPTCNWFLKCTNKATQQVEHPTIGWVDICDEHLVWLAEDDVPNPTKFVPPLAARHGAKIADVLAQLDADLEDEDASNT